MCISYCHRLDWLYWNHPDCDDFCPVGGDRFPPCGTCRHRLPGQCGLTRAPLPPGESGCCHHNIEPRVGARPVTREMLAPLGIRETESEAQVLARSGVSCKRGAEGRLWIEPARLALPYTYGRGTEQLPDEDFDWSDWFLQWEDCEVNDEI